MSNPQDNDTKAKHGLDGRNATQPDPIVRAKSEQSLLGRTYSRLRNIVQRATTTTRYPNEAFDPTRSEFSGSSEAAAVVGGDSCHVDQPAVTSNYSAVSANKAELDKADLNSNFSNAVPSSLVPQQIDMRGKQLFEHQADASRLTKAGRAPTQRLGTAHLQSWFVVAVSTVGKSHSEKDEPCEDAWAIVEKSNGLVVAIISDGAGSAIHSRFASQFVSNGATLIASALEQLLDDGTAHRPALLRIAQRRVRAQLAGIRQALIDEATEAGHHPDDYLATVVGVAAHHEFGALIFHIGDGTAAAFGADNQPIFVSQPENGEYENETYFLIEDIWESHLRFRFVRPTTRARTEVSRRIRDMFLMTDGATDIAYGRKGGRREPAMSFFVPVIETFARETRERSEALVRGTLLSEGANERSDDDKTILWLRPRCE